MKKFFVVLCFLLVSLVALSQNVGIGTTLPKARLHVVDSSVLFSAPGTGPINPGNPPLVTDARQMMWYADKAAFRVGYVTSISAEKDNIGFYSFAAGFGCVAKGPNTFASGVGNYATGNSSTALGYFTSARGDGATAIGNGTISRGENAVAMGLGTEANGNQSLAFGFSSRANAYGSVAGGEFALAAGHNSIALGYQSTAQGQNAVAIGNGNFAVGLASIALGDNTNAVGASSSALGKSTFAWGNASTAMGFSTTANGAYATAMGRGTTAEGWHSTAMGYLTTASGDTSTAMGYNTVASGNTSTATGWQTTASGNYSTSMGVNTTASGHRSTALGTHVSTNGQAGAFIIGDASTTTTENSLTDHSFTARFAGGYRLYTNSATTIGVNLIPGANAWATISDIRRKENFAFINGEEFLQKIRIMNLVSWNYIGQDPKTFRHYGPMAQEFYAAFGKDDYGTIGNDTTINQADFDGVNLIAIQALEKRTAALQKENEELKTRLKKLEKLLIRKP